ncbi:hypothetical protein MMC11_006726 [Xylographa trunciseda]|nr:hypothetical protein [Xylographa trunciseda]
MPHTPSFRLRATALILAVLAAGTLGRAVPYTAFEGRSPFEGRQMEAIERLRLRGASEKEIFARFARPVPAPVAGGEAPSQWSGLLYSVLARLGVDGEQQGGVVESIEGKMAGGERENGKRAVGEGVEEMEKTRGSEEMGGETENGLQERSHEVAGEMGGMMDGAGHLDERDVGGMGEDTEVIADDERVAHERAVDMVENMQGKADMEQADSGAVEERWTGSENEHAQNMEHQASVDVSKNWKTSTEISVRGNTAIGKRRMDLDMENGGLEVHGQMGGLKAIRIREG